MLRIDHVRRQPIAIAVVSDKRKRKLRPCWERYEDEWLAVRPREEEGNKLETNLALASQQRWLDPSIAQDGVISETHQGRYRDMLQDALPLIPR
jgi:hypothetical protein